jgi:ADP-ribose pyrophosphatase YjhB (NUDIX family)
MNTVAPHMLASAVVLDAGGTRVMLARSGEYRRWDLPGGHVIGGEPLVEAARREVRECSDLKRFRVVEPHLAVQQDLVDCGQGEARHVDHIFILVADPDEPTGGFEVDDDPADAQVGWFAVTALPQPLAPGVSMHLHSALRTAFG